ncbi:MAG: hypothetical protein M1834_006417 [Cirrosporium novae-zelandiae]|nr:MAG: hypothetical protein M1834_006417 [Cirrosporium novae-zelandiae]
MKALVCSLLLALVPATEAIIAAQGKAYNFSTPATPHTSFATSNFTDTSDALTALSQALGSNVTIAYPLSLAYGSTIARVWTKQREPYPQAIVYPKIPQHVSIIMQFYSNAYALWGDEGFAIMCGGHADFGGAQSSSVIIDLQEMDSTQVFEPTETDEYAILKIGGGSKAGHVYDALDGTGWAFLGPRAATIGSGGFLLGGGLAFQTNRYGVGTDNLVGLEVVLINGTIIYASPNNQYNDLFWACQGAGWMGIGVITHFYIRAYPDPGEISVGTFAFVESNSKPVFEKITNFFENNTDPDAFPAVVYRFRNPKSPSESSPIMDRQFIIQINALYFGSQAKFNASFGNFYENASNAVLTTYTLKSLQQYLQVNYPYGYNRLFYGKSHTNATVGFWEDTLAIFKETINGLLARGDDPGNSLWVSEYMFPNWNNAGPENDSDTAWPHATTAHVTLTSPEWSNSSNTEYLYDRDKVMMNYLRDFQNNLDMPPIYDYPNYIAPYSNTTEVWGKENFQRLLSIKEKYDPQCLFNRGRVFATTACVSKGLANTSIQ